MSSLETFERSARGCGLVLLLVVTCVFTAGIFGLVHYFTTPEGDSVGTIGTDGRSSLDVALSPGDTLHFTLTYGFPLASFGFADGPARDSAVERALRASSLIVVVTPLAGGAPLEARCAPYNGRVSTVSEIMGTRTHNGALTNCVITITYAGMYRVVGTTTFVTPLAPTNVALDVRRANAGTR